MKTSAWSTIAAEGLCLIVLAYLLFVITGNIEEHDRLGVPEFALLALVLLYQFGLFKGLEHLVLTKDGLQAKWKKEIQEQRTEIEKLRFLIGSLITGYEIEHLRKLAADAPYPFRRHTGFDKEIRNLSDAAENTLPIMGSQSPATRTGCLGLAN